MKCKIRDVRTASKPRKVRVRTHAKAGQDIPVTITLSPDTAFDTYTVTFPS
jgi:hypothetical protein